MIETETVDEEEEEKEEGEEEKKEEEEREEEMNQEDLLSFLPNRPWTFPRWILMRLCLGSGQC